MERIIRSLFAETSTKNAIFSNCFGYLSHVLLTAQSELKKSFVGIDPIIDELIHQIRIWYIMPELLSKPVIINLWGMTGVGKTDLVRKLVQLLHFEDSFAEIELSNSANSAYFRYTHSVFEILQRYSIQSNTPAILFFDEIQKFRTINEEKKDISDLQFQDFWELLSDGKLSRRDQSIDLEELFLDIVQQTQRDDKEKKHPDAPPRESTISGWEARRLKNILGLSRNLPELKSIANSTTTEALALISEQVTSKKIFQTHDYRLALIIISGNLDEAYEMAKQTQEAEIDPDIFHAQTSKISLIEIKQALTRRFKPEQISRFGNIHLIYPSLRTCDFERLINEKLSEIRERIQTVYGVRISFDKSLEQLIFNNGVFPVQGVRPVFSAIGDIVESNVSKILFTCLTESYTGIELSYDVDKKELLAILANDSAKKMLSIPYIGRIDRVRQSHSQDMIALTSAHEAGHSVAYALLFGLAPLQLKSNLASSATAGFTFPHLLEITKKTSLEKIQVLLAGFLAEKILFGSENVSSGSSSDLETVTNIAAAYIRKFGFAEQFIKVMPETASQSEEYSTDLESTNPLLSELVSQESQKVEKLLLEHKAFLLDVSHLLAKKAVLSPEEFVKIAVHHGVKCQVKNEDYKIIVEYSQQL